MTKWEHRLVVIPTSEGTSSDAGIRELLQVGEEGWEAVGICEGQSSYTVLFKRPAQSLAQATDSAEG